MIEKKNEFINLGKIKTFRIHLKQQLTIDNYYEKKLSDVFNEKLI